MRAQVTCPGSLVKPPTHLDARFGGHASLRIGGVSQGSSLRFPVDFSRDLAVGARTPDDLSAVAQYSGRQTELLSRFP